jgi:hypothetical protein
MHFVTPIIDLAPSWPGSFTVRITISLKLNTFNQGALTNHSPKSILAGSYICLLILPATTIIFQTLICFHIFTQAHSWLSSFLKTCTNCLQDSPFVQFSFILSVVNNKSGQYSDITSRSMSNLCILLLFLVRTGGRLVFTIECYCTAKGLEALEHKQGITNALEHKK